MGKSRIETSYYENNDFSSELKDSGVIKYAKAGTKRITMNISELVYADANELDKYMKMGYQNVLKTAIILGLNDLHKRVNTNTRNLT